MPTATTGPVQGSATGPRFIFGRPNANWRAATGGGAGAADGAEAIVANITAQLAKRLGHKPTPAQVQALYRRRLMAQVRGRMLAAMMEKSDGKPPTPEDFRAAMDRWRQRNLLDQMAAVNAKLGTTGTGYAGGGVNPPRRPGWRKRLGAALAAAARTQAGTSTTPTTSTTTTSAVAAKAALLDLRKLADRTADRLQRQLRALLEAQAADVADRVTSRAEAVARKPADDSLWWDAGRWDRELGRILEPAVEALAEMADEHVGAKVALAAPARAGKAARDPYRTALTRILRSAGGRITDINATTRKEIRAVVRQGVREGVSSSELGARIKAATAFGDARAEMIARTETGTALNQAQLASYRAFEFDAVQVSDGTNDAECAAANGAIWTLDEAEAQPLGHPNCIRDFSPVIGGT